MTYAPKDSAFADRVRASFANQTFMDTLGATLDRVEPGLVQIALVPTPKLSQQHGYIHAGVVSTIADSACGYAALTLMSAGSEVLSVEFKVNLLAPAIGERIVATARVIRSGRTLTVSQADVVAIADGAATHIAMMQATMICVPKER